MNSPTNFLFAVARKTYSPVTGPVVNVTFTFMFQIMTCSFIMVMFMDNFLSYLELNSQIQHESSGQRR